MTNVLLYFIGLAVFGFLYWLLDGILDIFIDTGVADTTTFTPWELMIYVWAGIVIVYLVFGGIWLVRSFQKETNIGGMQ
jgi:heme/copper-type cytochrome/quinol oxidase subunit 4